VEANCQPPHSPLRVEKGLLRKAALDSASAFLPGDLVTRSELFINQVSSSQVKNRLLGRGEWGTPACPNYEHGSVAKGCVDRESVGNCTNDDTGDPS
jgi:hypothetical protein